MAWGVSTEWDDIHRRLGNLPEKPKEPTQEEIMSELIEVVEQSDPFKYLSSEQLEEVKDDIDEDIYQKYRKQRLKELQEAAKRPKYAQVIEISKTQFISEVSEAPKEVFVIVHLYQDYIVHCKLIDEAFSVLCQKFFNHKFVKIQATRCIENFRDSDTPAVLVYLNGEVKHQLLGCAALFGGNQISPDSIEWVLAELKVWNTDLEESPLKRAKTVKKVYARRNEDESDSDDDREYMSNQIRKYKF
jgi:thiol-disulfide isomerase/thioredoxin